MLMCEVLLRQRELKREEGRGDTSLRGQEWRKRRKRQRRGQKETERETGKDLPASSEEPWERELEWVELVS